jgi:predicted house-cleaning NTP pyrophosphatase (Maf/HAM1 superfamily)
VEAQQQKNDELAQIRYSFNYIEDGEWPAAWRDGGLPAPVGYETIAGAIDIEKWNDKSIWKDYFSTDVKFLGLRENAIKDYFDKLRASGFIRRENYGTVTYVNYLRLGGDLHRVQLEQKKNDEIAQINYRFEHIEDGEWPVTWRDGGLPAPGGYEAIAGAIDMKKWNDKSTWRDYYSTDIKFVGLSENAIKGYFNKLRTSGFVRRDNYGTVTYVNYLRLGGVLHRVQLEQKKNDEIAQINCRFEHIEDGEWPAAWNDGGLSAPEGYKAIAGAIDMKKWNDKSTWRDYYSTDIKFVGLSENGIKDYFSKLQASGFVRRDNYGTVTYVNYLRLGGGLHRVQMEQKKNEEISHIN